MRSFCLRYVLTGFVLIATSVMLSGDVAAQCDTCAVPTVAYQPVAVQPTVAYRPYTGWYPGKLLDQWRIRRATRAANATAPVYTAAYTPYTAAYGSCSTCAPYTAAYAPTYTPYVSSYAPLASPVVAPCTTCAQTVARPVLMRPVIAPACNTCSFTSPCSCGTCDSCCSAGVSQAAYAEPSYSQPGCASCAGGGSVTSVVPSSPAVTAPSGQNIGPQTPQPSLTPEPAPLDSTYRSNRPTQEGSDSRGLGAPENDVNDIDPLEEFDPGPAAEEDSSTYFNAPRLLDPSDRTALRRSSRKPTVDVWNAVYRKPVAAKSNVTRTSTRRVRTQAEIDADGWAPVRRDR